MPRDPQKPLVILEMANNHMGELGHGLAIVERFAQVVAPHRARFDFGFKLQYRDLDSFIHPDFHNRTDIKHIKRFLETRLGPGAFRELKEAMADAGFLTVCTPFDERSVDLVETHGFDYLKVASCAVGDWPLMERLAAASLPLIASTGGAAWATLDRVVSFFDNRRRSLALLHCVAEYPTATARMRLDRIAALARRYPEHTVGFSSHEDPQDLATVRMAVAMGARILERHVGLATDRHTLNAYSMDPEACAAWLEAAEQAFQACSGGDQDPDPAGAESASLLELRRGVFAAADLAPGQRLDPDALFLAMPAVPGQLTANDLGKYVEFTLKEAVPARSPIRFDQVAIKDHHARVRGIVERVQGFLRDSHTTVGPACEVEISHHYGLDRFEETGATIISVVNRAYCKKLIVLLPGQTHPEQYHREKEETFHILHGSLRIRLDGVDREAAAGDVITVERGVRHAMTSAEGCILEEISSTHHLNDSYYTDPAIGANRNRKTALNYFVG